MELLESGGPWQELPPWAQFLVDFGRSSCSASPSGKRLTLISMPCDSAGASLVMLGALCHRLTLPDANDIAAHLKRLRELPIERYPHTQLKNLDNQTKSYQPFRRDENALWVQEQLTGRQREHYSQVKRPVFFDERAHDWYFAGEPRPETNRTGELAYGAHYGQFIPRQSPIDKINLRRTDSALCFVGRQAGKAPTKRIAEGVRLRRSSTQATEATLADLLAIHAWTAPGATCVSRVCFYNSLTRKMDREAVTDPEFVVADGSNSFKRAVDKFGTFPNCHVVGFVHRLVRRGVNEELAEKLQSLRRWYQPVPLKSLVTTQIPQGIYISALQER